MKLLKLTSLVLTLLLSQLAGANVLYSWKHSDGTPTFSPDPPPKGVPYVIVGPDLKPIPQPLPGLRQSNPAQSQPLVPQSAPQAAAGVAATAAAPVKKASDIVMTPAPGSVAASPQKTSPQIAPETPPADWKPVTYANDPNPARNTPPASAQPTATTPVPAPAGHISAECLNVKQQLLVLESKFANAVTATEMDTAVVMLSNYKKNNKGLCGL